MNDAYLEIDDVDTGDWVDVCNLDDIVPSTGVCALVSGQQIAVVRAAGSVFAISNFDPFSKAFVLSRGIVGDKRGTPKIASPIYKHCFDLRTGACLEDATVTLPVYACRVRAGRVEVLLPARANVSTTACAA